MLLDGTGSIQNRQCQIDGAGSSATGSGDTLTLMLNVSYSVISTTRSALLDCSAR
jgi:hypothetical protein